MPVEGAQSAFRYRNRPRQNHIEDTGGEVESSNLPILIGIDSSTNQTTANKLMADAFLGTVGGRLAQEIHDEFLVCKICFESYNNPKCLACLHTFCAKCIEQHISAEVTYNKYTDYRDFTCPLCRKRTQLPLGGVKRLADNFLISGLTELVLRQRSASHSSSSVTLTPARNKNDVQEDYSSSNEDENGDALNQLPRLRRKGIKFGECEICAQVCGFERGHSTEPTSRNQLTLNESTERASSTNLSNTPQASSKCLDCNKLLCVDCVIRHRSTKVTKEHATFDLQSGKDIECKEHPDESIRFYCEACAICICVLCTFNEHREHEVTSFGEAVTYMRQELETGLEDASSRIVNSHARLNSVGELALLVHNLERQIHETTEHFITLMQKQEQELLQELREFLGEKNIQTIDQHLTEERQLESAERLYNETVKYVDGQEIDLLLSKKEVRSKLKQLQELDITETEFDPICSEILFHPGTVQLGYLTTDLSGPPTDQYEYLQMPLSSSQSSVELANRPCVNTSGTQTDPVIFEKAIQPSQPAPPPKEERLYRARACNTLAVSVADKETNTRPRGVHTVISFSESISNANSEEFLTKLGSEQLNLQSMDNLTRARVRRKLKEHNHTFDSGTGSSTSGYVSTNHRDTLVLNGDRTRPLKMRNSDYILRRYSSADKHYH